MASIERTAYPRLKPSLTATELHALDITERVYAEQELKQAYATLEDRVQERTATLQAN